MRDNIPTTQELADDAGSTERLVFFSDAVFAIAMTLLVIDIHVPEASTEQDLWQNLLLLWPNLLGFTISFFVIGTYWRVHHRMFRYIKRYDQGLISWNFMLLFLVALLPFTTALINEHGNWQVPAVIYDANLLLASLVFLAIWRHATKGRRLVDAALSQEVIRYNTIRSWHIPLAFVFVMLLTFVMNPAKAQLGLWILVPIGWIERVHQRRREARVRPAAPAPTPRKTRQHPPKV